MVFHFRVSKHTVFSQCLPTFANFSPFFSNFGAIYPILGKEMLEFFDEINAREFTLKCSLLRGVRNI